jgi:hypothetical protein
MIKVHVLQVSAKLPKEMALLRRYVAAGRTQGEHWQSVSKADPGDIAVWYEAGTQVYTAWGWVSGPPVHIGRGVPFGPYRSPVAGPQWLPAEVKRETVREASGFKDGHQGPQTVPDEKAVAFLVAVGLLPPQPAD